MARKIKQGVEPQQELAEMTASAPIPEESAPEESAPEESEPTTRVVSAPESATTETASAPVPQESEKTADPGIAKDKALYATTRTTLESQVKEYNELMQSGKYDDARTLEEKIKQNEAECIKLAWNICKNTLRGMPDPMLAAINQLTYRSIRTKVTNVKEIKEPVMSVEEIDRPINILQLHQAVDGGIGYDKSWPYMIEKFNFLMTAMVIREMFPDGKEGDKQAAAALKTLHSSYAMSQTARDIEMGGNLTGKTKILKALQGIVTAMVGPDYKALTHDVRYLDRVYTRKDRAALKVNCANHRHMREYCAEICHRIVTGKVYEVGYKAIKAK